MIDIRMVTEQRRIVQKLEANFKTLANFLTEIKFDDLDKNPADPKLRAFLSRMWYIYNEPSYRSRYVDLIVYVCLKLFIVLGV